jgi:hypothetical protein
MTPPPGTPFDGLHVLLAEDNRTNRMLIQAFLAALPLRLSFACDGHEAVAHTLDLRPDIVLMDISMPGLDGLAATAEIRRSSPAQPRIIALTANTTPSHQAACLAAGMDAFLPKPVQRNRLLHLLQSQATDQSSA